MEPNENTVVDGKKETLSKVVAGVKEFLPVTKKQTIGTAIISVVGIGVGFGIAKLANFKKPVVKAE